MGSPTQGGQMRQQQTPMAPQQSQQGKGPGLPMPQQQMGGNKPYQPVGANNGPFNPNSVQPVNQPLQMNNGVNNPNFNPLQNNPQLAQLANNPHLLNAMQMNPNVARLQAAKGAPQAPQVMPTNPIQPNMAANPAQPNMPMNGKGPVA